MFEVLVNYSERLSYEQISNLLDIIDMDKGETDPMLLSLAYITVGVLLKMKGVEDCSEDIDTLNKKYYQTGLNMEVKQ